MVIFESHFATLEHDIGLNLLKVTYRDRRGYRLADVAELMRHIRDRAIPYRIKSLLLDSSRSLNPMQADESEAASRYIVIACQRAGLRRVARVGSPSLFSELKVIEGINRVSETVPFRFLLRTFQGRAEAIDWLAQS